MAQPSPIYSVSYQFEVPISAEAERVWQALFDEINDWWIPSFRMVAPDSMVTFSKQAGGGLTEASDEHGSLLWYTVQWIQHRPWNVYLVGHLGPDWGGPATTHFRISLEEADGQTIFKVQDALTGDVNEKTATTLKAGWTQLFTEGLKPYLEGRG